MQSWKSNVKGKVQRNGLKVRLVGQARGWCLGQGERGCWLGAANYFRRRSCLCVCVCVGALSFLEQGIKLKCKKSTDNVASKKERERKREREVGREGKRERMSERVLWVCAASACKSVCVRRCV